MESNAVSMAVATDVALGNRDGAARPPGPVPAGDSRARTSTAAAAEATVAHLGQQRVAFGVVGGVIAPGPVLAGLQAVRPDQPPGPAPPGQVLVDDHLPDVGLGPVQPPDLVPPRVHADQDLLHDVLGQRALTGQHGGEAHHRPEPGGREFLERHPASAFVSFAITRSGGRVLLCRLTRRRGSGAGTGVVRYKSW
jgi:hypothetical protein